jgi:hypothetical protein
MHKKLSSVLVMVAILSILGPVASAQSPVDATTRKVAVPKQTALVGSWLETVSFPPETGRPPLKSLGSFHVDGTMVCSDQGAVTTEPPSVFTSCHGVWTHLKDRTFAYTSFELISDLNGNLVGHLKVRGTYTVSPSGNEYNGTSFAQIRDTDGNVLFSVDVTNTGQRIQVELP